MVIPIAAKKAGRRPLLAPNLTSMKQLVSCMSEKRVAASELSPGNAAWSRYLLIHARPFPGRLLVELGGSHAMDPVNLTCSDLHVPFRDLIEILLVILYLCFSRHTPSYLVTLISN